jgi:glycosyltransferase involved in cell wall biosynthesis
MKLSVVMATRNKAPYLRRTLDSICSQEPPFPVEVIVVDDGSTDDTFVVCAEFPVRYTRIDRPHTGNNAVPFNMGYRMAKGNIILTTSDEVEHKTPNLMEQLVARMTPTTFLSPRVYNVDEAGTILESYCGPGTRSQLLCTAVWREDLYAVGGHDEEFVGPGGNDTWLLNCLGRLPRRFTVCRDLVAWHYDHPKPLRATRIPELRKLWAAKNGLHPWTALSGAWPVVTP